jgi:lysozyme family protein
VSVKAIQQALAAAGFDPGPVDGIRGPKTIAAIKAFQRAKGLVVDGIVGPETTAAFGGGAAPAPAAPAIDSNLLAQSFGFAMAVLNSDASLKGLFDRAVAETWTPDKFQAELRATPWYQQHSEQWRNTAILKASDPTSYATNLAQVQTHVAMMASDMGAQIGGIWQQLGEQAYTLGWDDNQLRQTLSTYIQYTDGRMLGLAGQNEQLWRQRASDNGLTLSNDWYRTKAMEVANGNAVATDGVSQITEMAASAFPHLADRLRAGETVATIASPYLQAMASTLELNPESLTVADPTIQRALSSVDATGKPVLRTLYDFQTDLRKDTRWLKTQNAQDSAIGTTRKILSDFGLVG